ncbi:MAG: hypothetical protein HQL95_03500 [Magnetococcales bacterium]|nr:hypothetical protein [Magnetococcales bacterium]
MDHTIQTQLCFSIDVEWAHPVVLADLLGLFDAAGVRCTLFVTHAGVVCGGHERGIHPNFRRNGESMRQLFKNRVVQDEQVTESVLYEHVLATTLGYAPDAIGSRSHALFMESGLLPLFKKLGLKYDASVQMPLVSGLHPWRREQDIVMIPTWYTDHADLMAGYSEFDIKRLPLDSPGLKVFDFHPNLVYLNAPDDAFYQTTKSFYHDPEQLLRVRYAGRGVRTLLLDLLEFIARRGETTVTLNAVNHQFRARLHQDPDVRKDQAAVINCC